MNMATQADSASQSYEETQIESDTFMEHQLGLDRLTEEEEGEEEKEPPPPKPWARLVSLSPLVPHQDLYLEQEGEGEGGDSCERRQCGLYTLGRGSKCSFVFKQKLISNEHSRLYCLKESGDGNKHKLCPYIEDNSANGTYVNKSTRLRKGVRRVLHDGDLVSLVNPDTARPGGAAAGDVEAASFFIHIFLPTEQPARSTNANMISSILGAEGRDGGASLHNMRSATVTHLLGQERNIFDYYDQKEMLGSGANGQVYRCIHKVDGHECAVKATSMRSCTGGGEGGLEQPSLERVLMEAHMIRALKHPNIIQLEDVFSDQNTLFLVMELVRGGDLFDRIVARGRYEEEAAKVVMQQTLSAMQFMHDKNVAHRDMKPENILLLSRESDLDVKITDFGLAKSSEDSGGLKTFCGTPHYFAPEVQNMNQPSAGVASGQQQPTYGFEADMWSIGVIAYVLLSGDYPWSSDSSLMCQEIAAARPNFQKNKNIWQSLSPDAMDFISQLIVLDPRARLTAEQALQHTWLDSVRPRASLPRSSSPQKDDCSNVKGNSNMPPPTTVTRQAKSKKKRTLDDFDSNPPQPMTAVKRQLRSSRSRVAASSSSGAEDGHAPMEISLTATTRSRLPRKAKQISINNDNKN